MLSGQEAHLYSVIAFCNSARLPVGLSVKVIVRLHNTLNEVTATVSQSQSLAQVIYPDSDRRLMSDNTKQFRWITTIQQNLDWLFVDRLDVFVAGDLLWYPIEGNNKISQAPDVMVVFGRPKGDPCGIYEAARGSYQQWNEANIPPQIVFEILSS